MDSIAVRGYQVSLDNEDQELEALQAQGFSISDPVLVDGVHIGHLAVKFDPWNVATEAVLVSAVPD